MPGSLKVYDHLGECDQVSPDFPKDAVHGMNRDVPDIHLYYQWLMHEQSGVKYSHYDLLLPCEPGTLAKTIVHLPAVVKFADCESQPVTKPNPKIAFFDSQSYAGRGYQFPELTGKLAREPKPDAQWAPADACDVQKFFDSTTYHGKSDFQFPKLEGRLTGYSDLNRERFHQMFRIKEAQPPTQEALVKDAAAIPLHTELETRSQSIEVASVVPDALDAGDVHGEPSVDKQQLPVGRCEALNPVQGDEAVETTVSMLSESGVPQTDDVPQISATQLEHVETGHDDVGEASNVPEAPDSVSQVEPLQTEYDGGACGGDASKACAIDTKHEVSGDPANVEPSPMEQKLFKLFQPLLNGQIVPSDHASESSDNDQAPSQPVDDSLVSTGNMPDQLDVDNEPSTTLCEAKPQPAVHEETMEPVEQKQKWCAIRLTGEVIQQMVKSTTAQCVFKWKHNLQQNTSVCFVDGGQVVATAQLSGIDVIECFADLRTHAAFQGAGVLQKETWRNAVTKEKKKLYVWTFVEVKSMDTVLELPPSRGRCVWVDLNDLKPYVDKKAPAMDLRETCEFFINRLPDHDFHKMEERLRALDGKTISIGSTCSGTDICISMMKATMAKLGEMFGVSELLLMNLAANGCVFFLFYAHKFIHKYVYLFYFFV